MENVLGLLAFALFIALIISMAASITWLVVKLSPPKHQLPQPKSE
jgi:hypothetical protein